MLLKFHAPQSNPITDVEFLFWNADTLVVWVFALLPLGRPKNSSDALRLSKGNSALLPAYKYVADLGLRAARNALQPHFDVAEPRSASRRDERFALPGARIADPAGVTDADAPMAT